MCAYDKKVLIKISQNLLFIMRIIQGNIIKFVEDKFLFLTHSLEGGLVKIVEGANNTVHFAKKSTVTSMVQDYMTIFPSAANDK